MNQLKLGEILSTLFNIIQAYFDRILALSHLATLEAKLALKTLIAILILFFILSIVMFSLWFSFLFLLFQFLLSYYSPLVSASLIVGFNLVVFIIILAVILIIKKNLSFPYTRKHLQQFNPRHEELTDENPTSEN